MALILVGLHANFRAVRQHCVQRSVVWAAGELKASGVIPR